MILSWSGRDGWEVFNTGRSRTLPSTIWSSAKRKLEAVDAATDVNALRTPPGNRLEARKGELAGFFSIRVNDQYRIVFRWEDGNAHEVSIQDYH